MTISPQKDFNYLIVKYEYLSIKTKRRNNYIYNIK